MNIFIILVSFICISIIIMFDSTFNIFLFSSRSWWTLFVWYKFFYSHMFIPTNCLLYTEYCMPSMVMKWITATLHSWWKTKRYKCAIQCGDASSKCFNWTTLFSQSSILNAALNLIHSNNTMHGPWGNYMRHI